jgi:hypothetical protein
LIPVRGREATGRREVGRKDSRRGGKGGTRDGGSTEGFRGKELPVRWWAELLEGHWCDYGGHYEAFISLVPGLAMFFAWQEDCGVGSGVEKNGALMGDFGLRSVRYSDIADYGA